MTSLGMTVQANLIAPANRPTLRSELVIAERISRFLSKATADRTLLPSNTETHPNYRQTWCDRGLALLTPGCHEKAVRYLNRAIVLAPEQPEVWHGRGDALANLSRHEEALASLDQSLELAPNRHETWIFRAVVLIYLERYSEALESCEQALALEPGDQEACLFRGVALQRMGQFKAAYAAYDSALGVQRTSLWQRIYEPMQALQERVSHWLLPSA
jgi:tetratricopeptide (TPR) repeat protein